MLHFVMFYMKQNKSHTQTLESVRSRLEISFNIHFFLTCLHLLVLHGFCVVD